MLTRVGDRALALPVECVVETLRPLPIEPIADAPHHVLGMSRIRGAPCPVIDAARLFGIASAAPARRWVVLRLPPAAAVPPAGTASHGPMGDSGLNGPNGEIGAMDESGPDGEVGPRAQLALSDRVALLVTDVLEVGDLGDGDALGDALPLAAGPELAAVLRDARWREEPP